MPGKNPKAGPGPGEVCQRSRPSTRRSDKIEKFDIMAFSGTAAFFLFVCHWDSSLLAPERHCRYFFFGFESLQWYHSCTIICMLGTVLYQTRMFQMFTCLFNIDICHSFRFSLCVFIVCFVYSIKITYDLVLFKLLYFDDIVCLRWIFFI